MEKLERSIKKINKRLSGKNDHLHIGSPLSKSLFSKKMIGSPSKENVQCGSIEEQTSTDSIRLFEQDSLKEINLSPKQNLVGFSYLPQQIHRKLLNNLFTFTLMVVGQSGLGKSTLVNTMFLTDIYSNKYPGPSKRVSKTLTVESTSLMLKENSVQVHLTVVDTPGFGDSLDNTNCWQAVSDYVDKRYFDYLNAELFLRQRNIVDHRVHCILYFIQPTGHGLRTIDIEFMKHIHDKVNVIPVIAKADTLTPDELAQFKINVMQDLKANHINAFLFDNQIDDQKDVEEIRNLAKRAPFAIVASDQVYEENGSRKRGRKYPWGIIDIENLDHCDFKALRDLLIKHCMYDLIEHTHSVHYEHYRSQQLPEILDKLKSNSA